MADKKQYMILMADYTAVDKCIDENAFTVVASGLPSIAAARREIQRQAKEDYLEGGDMSPEPDPDWGATYFITEVIQKVQPTPYIKNIQIDLVEV